MTTQNTHDYPSHFPRRSNLYVPNMVFSADVDRNGYARCELGAPVALSANGIIAAQSIANALVKSAAGLNAAGHRTNMAKYGRNVTIALSGAGTPTVTIFGLDYLGQPMSEDIVAAGAGTVAGKKAFKEVVAISTAAVAATTINVGWGNVLGLPYAAGAFIDEFQDGVAAGAGTKVVAILVAQTATTGDPRGTYLPAVACDGTKDLVLLIKAIEGDYHGLRHFTA